MTISLDHACGGRPSTTAFRILLTWGSSSGSIPISSPAVVALPELTSPPAYTRGAAASITGAGIAIGAGGDDDSDTPITGVELERASDAALTHLGEGRVTDTEVGDEESYYEVEVTLDDGSQVDVQLDEEFNVVGVEDDDEFPDDGED